MVECCANCVWYCGGSYDETEFCDEQERYVRGTGYCPMWTDATIRRNAKINKEEDKE